MSIITPSEDAIGEARRRRMAQDLAMILVLADSVSDIADRAGYGDISLKVGAMSDDIEAMLKDVTEEGEGNG